MATPRVVLTRPEPEASVWMQELAALGCRAMALPLLQLRSPSNLQQRQALNQVWANLGQYQVLMFVSAAAARFFFAACPDGWVGARPSRAWAPGPATARAVARAAADAGWTNWPVDQPAANASQFDSEALWAQVQLQIGPGSRLLIVRGSTPAVPSGEDALPLPGRGRDWLAQQCLARGAQVEAVVAYERVLPDWRMPETRLALDQALHIPFWQIGSSESLQALAPLPRQHWANKTALVSHPRIGEAAQACGFATVVAVDSGPAAIAAALESLPC